MKINIQQLGDPDDVSMVMHTTSGRKELSTDGTRIKCIHYHEHWNGRFKNIYRYGCRFLKKNVGRPWNTVFSELCEKIKTDRDLLSQYGWEGAKDIIRGMVDIYNHQETYRWNNRYKDDFYVDDNGILRTHLKDKPAHHKDHIQVRQVVGYRFSGATLPYKKEVISLIHSILGNSIAMEFENDVISVEAFDKVMNRWGHYYGERLKPILKKVYIKEHPGCKPDSVYSTYDEPKSLFEVVYTTTTVTNTKNQRIKHRAEMDSRGRADMRENNRLKKQKEETLLHDLEHRRKAEERRLNSIKIQAHGIDESTSFRGEEYHGQKRKKK